ncbi:MAG: hypothetical protein AB1728_03820 [Bacteroidota bacterium]
MSIIGIAGTAKNTGKTTTLNALLHKSQFGVLDADNTSSVSFRADEGGEKSASPPHIQSRFLTRPFGTSFRMTTGVTSIGYDGEEIDNITSLPKPRIFLHHGMIASTSLQCVPARGWSIIQKTGLYTALGEIVIVRCETPGLIVLAGPNKRSELEKVVRQMTDLGCKDIFVDGSLNRIAPMSVVDKIIFTTGAARTTDIAALVEEMKAIEFLFQFGKTQWNNKQNNFSINVIPSEAKNLALPAGSSSSTIIDATEVEKLILHYKEDCRSSESGNPLIINGLITSIGLQTLTERIRLLQEADRPHEIIFTDPISLLLSGEPQRTAQHIAQLTGLNIIISYRKPILLAAITVNPFYPEYRGTTYTAAYVEATLLISSMKRSLHSPLFDMMRSEITESYRNIL